MVSSVKPATTRVFDSFSSNSLVYLIVLFRQKFPLVSVIVVVGIANLSCCCDHCMNVANKPDKNNVRQGTPPSELILFRSHVTSVFQGLSLSRSVGRVGENPGNEVAEKSASVRNCKLRLSFNFNASLIDNVLVNITRPRPYLPFVNQCIAASTSFDRVRFQHSQESSRHKAKELQAANTTDCVSVVSCQISFSLSLKSMEGVTGWLKFAFCRFMCLCRGRNLLAIDCLKHNLF